MKTYFESVELALGGEFCF